MQADRKRIERLLKTARGQIDGILRMVEEDRYCMDISAQVMAADAILRKVNQEIISAHMKGCVKAAILDGNGDEKIDELMAVVDKLTK
ncbi:MAG: metal-sensing transcriptional repressor [Lachnospiraceae bacterium]|nr:metal-sensing transcriptional repressor [Lachnospiraceae bacterium]